MFQQPAEVLPPRLLPGQRVALVSPASYPEPRWVDESVAILESWGLEVRVGRHVLDSHGYMAGSDQDRLSDLNGAIRDPEIRAIITTRGGAGAYRIADGMDFEALRTDPKPVVGFSDITYLHLAMWARARVPGIHGCLAGENAQTTVRQLLMTTEPVALRRDPLTVSAEVLIEGRASGRLLGGSLTAVATSVGCRLPDLSGAILFLEEVRAKGLGIVDRQLTQLLASGAIARVSGIVLGSFEGFAGINDRGWNIIDVLRDRLAVLGVPVLGGIRAGHDLVGEDGQPDQFALGLGGAAEFDVGAGALTVAACVR
ncbi:MAG: S66 peptidase family protein [Acidimicrobiales bacterium]